jgi:hypothetical protein
MPSPRSPPSYRCPAPRSLNPQVSYRLNLGYPVIENIACLLAFMLLSSVALWRNLRAIQHTWAEALLSPKDAKLRCGLDCWPGRFWAGASAGPLTMHITMHICCVGRWGVRFAVVPHRNSCAMLARLMAAPRLQRRGSKDQAPANPLAVQRR